MTTIGNVREAGAGVRSTGLHHHAESMHEADTGGRIDRARLGPGERVQRLGLGVRR